MFYFDITAKVHITPVCKIYHELKSNTKLNSTNLLSVVFVLCKSAYNLSEKFKIQTCHNLQFCHTNFDSIYPLYILTYASVKIVGDMLTKKVKMYGGYIDILRTIPEFIFNSRYQNRYSLQDYMYV